LGEKYWLDGIKWDLKEISIRSYFVFQKILSFYLQDQFLISLKNQLKSMPFIRKKILWWKKLGPK